MENTALGTVVSVFLDAIPFAITGSVVLRAGAMTTPKVFLGKTDSSYTLDFLMLVLSIVELWKLHLKATQKISLAIVFFTGRLGCDASVVRFVVIKGLPKDNVVLSCKQPAASCLSKQLHAVMLRSV
ncbi:hypothetical protein BDW75DRAFT_244986 [Aspergillus navahoensis]